MNFGNLEVRIDEKKNSYDTIAAYTKLRTKVEIIIRSWRKDRHELELNKILINNNKNSLI